MPQPTKHYLLGLLCVWATCFGPGSPLALIIWLISVSVAAYKRHVGMLMMFVLLSPFGLVYGFGVLSYIQGNASIRSSGYSDAAMFGTEPQTRARRSVDNNCLSHGGEWVWKLNNDVAVRTMAVLFGPMRGSYHGPYPSLDEATEFVLTAEPTLQLDEHAITTANQRYRIDPEVGRWLESEIGQLIDMQALHLDDNALRVVRAGMTADGVLVVGNDKGLVMIDPHTGRAFAYTSTITSRRGPLPPRWRP